MLVDCLWAVNGKLCIEKNKYLNFELKLVLNGKL